MSTRSLRRAAAAVALALLPPACAPADAPGDDPSSLDWTRIEERARGEPVTLAMWRGDPRINDYMDGYVVPALEREHGVRLTIIPGQGAQITAMLMAETEAGKRRSDVDLVWINGETFYQLRRIDALHGPFVSRLPNARYLDLENPFIRFDFQQEIEGYECPWGNVQQALIYDSARVAEPPANREALDRWVREHPGRFTFDTGFNGMTFLKSLLIDLAGGAEALAGPFHEERYREASGKLWTWIREIRPFLWRQGETFPTGVAELHQLYAGGEIDFTMSNNDAEVDNKVIQGLFPPTSRAYVLDGGMIQNSHYIGVVGRSGRLPAALVTVNFLISPEAQRRKLSPEVWGDGTVLAMDRLPPEWQERFRDVPGRRHAPPRSEIQDRALRELDAPYMIRLHDDFRTHVIAR